MELYPKLILDALATVRYPGTGKNVVEMNMVEDDMRIAGLHVSFSLIFDKPTDPFMTQSQHSFTKTLSKTTSKRPWLWLRAARWKR